MNMKLKIKTLKMKSRIKRKKHNNLFRFNLIFLIIIFIIAFLYTVSTMLIPALHDVIEVANEHNKQMDIYDREYKRWEQQQETLPEHKQTLIEPIKPESPIIAAILINLHNFILPSGLLVTLVIYIHLKGFEMWYIPVYYVSENDKHQVGGFFWKNDYKIFRFEHNFFDNINYDFNQIIRQEKDGKYYTNVKINSIKYSQKNIISDNVISRIDVDTADIISKLSINLNRSNALVRSAIKSNSNIQWMKETRDENVLENRLTNYLEKGGRYGSK